VCGVKYEPDDIIDMNGLSHDGDNTPRLDFLVGYGCPSCDYLALDSDKAQKIYADNDQLIKSHYQSIVKNGITNEGVCVGRIFSANAFNMSNLKDKRESNLVIDRDWDNLLVLDAARHDFFKQHITISGNLDKRFSSGSHSVDFVKDNFSNQSLHDTVCITANGWYGVADNLDFYKLVELYSSLEADERTRTVLDSDMIDDYTGAILPETVADATLSAHKNNPNKKLIAHFMQPHTPYIPHTQKWGDKDSDIILPEESEFTLASEGEITISKLREWYVDNLLYVESVISNLIKKLNGKTVVTADHGENLGDVYYGSRHFGHDVHTDKTRYVPWLEINYSNRRNIVKSDPLPKDSVDMDDVKNNLRNLGYTV
jgi:hypothetical protein